MEIKDIYRLQLNETSSVAFNQYGTNMYKYKYDPLAVIEAKFAIMATGTSKGGELVVTEVEKLGGMEGTKREIEELVHTQEHPSPDVGTQEAPLVDMSSQEEGIPSRTQVIRNTTEDLGLSEQTLKQTRMEKEYEDALEFTLDGKKGETLAENNLGQEERLEGHNASKDSPNNARVSPNWNELMEEKIAEPINQELSQEKGAVENLDEGEEKLEKTEAHKKYDQMVRQSERIKEQGLGG